MKISQKILLATSVLLCAMLILQGLFAQYLMKKELKTAATSQLNAVADSKLEPFRNLVSQTGEDFATMQSHNALELLFRGRSTRNSSLVADAMSQLRAFFLKLYMNKGKYSTIRITTAEGDTLLRIDGSIISEGSARSERLEKVRELIGRLEPPGKGETRGNSTAHKLLTDDSGNWELVSVSPILINGRMEGLFWVHQPIGDLMKKTFHDLAASKIYFLLADDHDKPIVYSGNLSATRVQGLMRTNLPGMVMTSQRLPALNLDLKLAIEKARAFNVLNNLFMIGTAILLLSLSFSILAIGTMANRISKPINDLKSWAERISIGDLTMENIVTTRDEIGDLNTSIIKVVNSFRDVSNICEAISNGDLGKTLKIRSDKDTLSKSVNEMVAALKEATIRNMNQNWLRNGIVELNDLMRGEQDIGALAENVVRFMATYLGMQVGRLFLANEGGGTFSHVGGFACDAPGDAHAGFGLGEGLAGEAAKQRRCVYVENLPDGYLHVISGLGASPPRYLVLAPLVYNNEVKGVMELGSFQPLTDLQKEFVEQVLENVGISLYSAQSRRWIGELLAKTRMQAEELSIQQEEMQQINEELEEQTQVLEKQKDELLGKNIEVENARRIIEEKARELEQSSRYKSQFLANMSHELRTPLNSLLILSNLLAENKEGNLTQKQVEYAGTIHNSGTDLLNLINEVLDLSKIEAGRMEINLDDLNLDDFRRGIERNFLHVAQDKGVSLSTERSDDVPEWIRTDRQRLDQIVRNFLSNAFKFTREGGITVSIGRPLPDADLSCSGLAADSAISIAVTDTGIGIPADKHGHIFEAFRQVDGSTSRQYGGTGLGLTISRDLARLLGGEIRMESEEGRGSTFTLYLPLAPDAGPGVGPARHGGDSDIMPADDACTRTMPPGVELRMDDIRDDRRNITPGERVVLIIEDDPVFARFLYDLAIERGFKGLIADDGEAGLYLAEHFMPHAVILDVKLPRMDGLKVLERLKSSTKTRSIPVHIISGTDRGKEAAKLGAIGFLAKPVSLDKLKEAFNTIELNIADAVRNLLIVEDDVALRNGTMEMFGEGNILATTAGTGAKALELLRSKRFDCLILDLCLPDVSGFDLLDQIRKDEDIPYLPVIVYTDRELSEDEDAMLRRLAESVIIKGTKSPERLLDETALFLHHVVGALPAGKQEMAEFRSGSEDILKDRKILVVDDDMRNVFALSSVMEGKGMKVEIARNGREALACLVRNPDIDIVVMDIMMPEMDGYEAMREIRKQERFRRLPIIAVTAKAMRGDRSACIEAGASDYLAKPIDMDKLMSLLRVWLYR